jgi:FkbM family methyltransferase
MSIKSTIKSLPHFKGKFRLIRFLYKDTISTAKNMEIEGKHGLRYLVPNLREIIGFEIFSDGIYEPETSDFILSRMPKNGILLDIGANIGSVVLPICKKKPSIKAICIEASPRVFSYLRTNIEQNKIGNCTLINNIVSDSDDKVVDFFSPEELFGKGSMSPVFTEVPEKVKTITVDKLLASLGVVRVDFIKIDIEGFEYYAFKGAANLLRSENAPGILFEFVEWAENMAEGIKPGDAQKLLVEFGYTLYKVSKGNRLTKLPVPLEKGETMIFATKAPLN